MKTASLIFVAAALALSACSKTPPAPAKSGAPVAKHGLAVSGGSLMLPAVKGNPAAAYFMVDNTTGNLVVLSTVAIDGADKAEIHQTVGNSMTLVDRVEIAPGTSMTFEPGKLHVMAFGLNPKIQPGGSAEMTLNFADGGKATALLKVEAAGSGSMGGGMP